MTCAQTIKKCPINNNWCLTSCLWLLLDVPRALLTLGREVRRALDQIDIEHRGADDEGGQGQHDNAAAAVGRLEGLR